MVFGTTVGAGMLGIPTMMAGISFGSAIFITILVWFFMAATGLLLLEVALKMPQGSNLISLAGRFLGATHKWIVGVLFLFLYYCLLVAYFSGGAPLLGGLFVSMGIILPPLAAQILFLFLFGGVIALGARWVSRVNTILAIGMFISYAILITMGAPSVKMQSVFPLQFSLASLAAPVLFSAFGFHNIIPSLATLFEHDKKTLRVSILGGTFLAFVFYLLWIWLVLGAVPVEALESVKQQGVPVTYALQAVTGNSSIYLVGQTFAFFALTTSFLGVGFSFVDFLRDAMLSLGRLVGRFFCVLATLIPPFICVLIDPLVFEEALGVAGGFGESILNGIIPVALFFQMQHRYNENPLSYRVKLFLLFLLIFSLFVIGVEGYAFF
jgi:tyrosine-specific transport protein